MAQGRVISSKDHTSDAIPPSGAPLRSHGSAILYGIFSTFLAFTLFALFVFLSSALFLLITAMETGSDISNITSQFTASLIVISQGIAIKTDSLVLSITPLGLSFIAIRLLRTVFIRRRNTVIGNIASVVTWTLLVALTAVFVRRNIDSPMWAIFVYPSCMALLSYAWSCTRDSAEYAVCKTQIEGFFSATTRRTLIFGLRTARRILYVYAFIGIITFIIWISLGYQSVQKVFDMTHMGIGSQIMSSIFTLAWLPNLVTWALAWTLGATISIGSLGHFNLWIDQSTHLPPIPIFGILPEAVSTDIAQKIILLIPIVLIIMVGLYSEFIPSEHALIKPRYTLRNMIDYVYPIGSFITSIIVTIPVFMLFIVSSSGALGRKNLAHIGLDFSHSLSSFGRPVQWGLILAWLVAIVIALGQSGILYVRNYLGTSTQEDAHQQTETDNLMDDDSDDYDDSEDSQDSEDSEDSAHNKHIEETQASNDAAEQFSPNHNHPREDNNE
ncbi:DUF6350 family protein [Alloscardovia omnicolens]|uniref:cell division protein PerM n=1 Tax=Alloscardovia omnicolens TaxID=419015 RepID=UPI003A69CFBB